MTTTIIDERGQVRHWSASADVAVKDMGCVALRRRGSRALELFYRPSAVSPMALLTAVELLNVSDCERVALASWTTGWQTSLFGDRAVAIKHLIGLTTQAQAPRKREFLSQRHALSAAAADATFGPVQHAWRETQGVMDHRLMQAVREASCGRYLVVDPRRRCLQARLGHRRRRLQPLRQRLEVGRGRRTFRGYARFRVRLVVQPRRIARRSGPDSRSSRTSPRLSACSVPARCS